jgi:hypothetical protein
MEMAKKKLVFKSKYTPFIAIGVLAIVLSVGFALTFLRKEAYVATGNIYIVPVKTAIQKDGEVRAVVRITPGKRIDTATASVKYDPDSFSYERADYTGSPFSTQIPAIVKNGIVTVQSAKLGGETVDADALIVTLLFVAKKDSAAFPTLIYGNAAQAGVATNPTVEGEQANETANPLAANTQSNNSQKDTAKITASPGGMTALSAPVASFLKKVGVSEAVAKKIAPWLTATMLYIAAMAIAFGIWMAYKYYKQRKKPKGTTI